MCDPIVTSHWPSSPAREQWSAVGADYAPGSPIGWGATAADATENLRENCDHPGEDIANGRHVCPDCGHEWDISYDPPGDY